MVSILGFLACAAPSHAGSEPPAVHEEVIVRRAQVAVNARGECPLEGAAGKVVKIDIDGEPAKVEAIDPVPEGQGVLHVIVLETSQLASWLVVSGNDRSKYYRKVELSLEKEIAAKYLEGLPLGGSPRHEAMVLAMSDQLDLAAGPTADRGALKTAIDGVPIGLLPRTDDALFELLSYLEGRPERKEVLILAGYVFPQPGIHSMSDVVGLAAGRADGSLVVNAIQLHFPMVGAFGLSRYERKPEPLLESVAKASGGEHSWIIDDVSAIPGVLSRLPPTSKRLGLLITYEPPESAVAEAARSTAGYTWKRLKVRSLLPGCDLDAARKDVLVASASKLTDDVGRLAARTVERRTADGRLEWARRTASILREDDPSVRERFSFLDPACVRSGDVLEYLEIRPGGIEACVEDPVREGGIRREKWQSRSFTDRSAKLGVRRVVVETPPLSEVQSKLLGPEDVLLRWLTIDPGLLERGSADAGGGPGPLMLGGGAFLEMAKHLGRAIADYPPDYARWRPGTWLGDVPARSVLARLEEKVARSMLGSEAASPAPEALLRAWPLLERWLGASDRWSSLVPLVPCYDASRDEVGFYRIVPPREAWKELRAGDFGRSPLIEALPDDSLPPYPMAVAAIRDLLSNEKAAALLRGGATLDGIAYASDRKTFRTTLHMAGAFDIVAERPRASRDTTLRIGPGRDADSERVAAGIAEACGLARTP